MSKVLSKDLLTEKGNLKAPVVANFKAQALSKIDLALEPTPNGEYAMVLGQGEDGKVFYLTVSLTVGSHDPFVKAVRKAKEKAEVVLEIPTI